jgi:hypothetical protein
LKLVTDFSKSSQVKISRKHVLREPSFFITGGWMDGWTDMTKPVVAMRNCSAKAPENGLNFTYLDMGKQITEESFFPNNSFTP